MAAAGEYTTGQKEIEKMEKSIISVRKNGIEVTKISRVLRAEQIGNFNPFFCTYKRKRTLVKSDAGDLSDPFRRELDYLKALFIEV